MYACLIFPAPAAAAVVFQGKAWQFKDFPYKGAAKGDLVETFSNIFGAYFHYKDDAVCPNLEIETSIIQPHRPSL